MKYLTFNERKIISQMYNKDQMKFREIGRVLKRHHTTISNEIQRNKYNLKYDPEKAHLKHLNIQMKKGNIMKLESNILLKNHITDELKEGFSPEQIIGRMKKVGLNQEIGCVCVETIYSFVYASKNKHLKLWKHLRRHRKKRKSYSGRQYRNRGSTIKKRISIHKRPKQINKRKRIGDWEVDLMIFSKQKKVLSVHVERKTRLTRLYICENKSKEEMFDTLRATALDLPVGSVKTITFDNGTENADHYKLREKLGLDIDTYFCDAYCSWQKGTVENMNMFIREYLPRNINLDNIDYDQLWQIQEKLNNRPRKCLDYLTPNESFYILSPTG